MDSVWRGWHSMVIKCMCKWLKPDLYFFFRPGNKASIVHSGPNDLHEYTGLSFGDSDS